MHSYSNLDLSKVLIPKSVAIKQNISNVPWLTSADRRRGCQRLQAQELIHSSDSMMKKPLCFAGGGVKETHLAVVFDRHCVNMDLGWPGFEVRVCVCVFVDIGRHFKGRRSGTRPSYIVTAQRTLDQVVIESLWSVTS